MESDTKILPENLFAIAEQFKPEGRIIDIWEFGNGNINNTFLVTLDDSEHEHFILQRINTQVFHQPALVMLNMRVCIDHIRRHLQQRPLGADRLWEMPAVLLTQDGRDHWIDSGGSFWRAISFIEGSQTFDTIKDISHAKEVGYALGIFHTLLSDLPHTSLSDTLKGFHITPSYLRRYNSVLAKFAAAKSLEVNYCIKFVAARNAWAHVLEDARADGKLCLRPIHGDPKVNNILIDTSTGQAVSIVDLDTIKPGLVHYDIGDCLRSGCNPNGEETELLEKIYFETDLCKAILQSYLSTAKNFLTDNDFYYLFDSIRLIAFELGVRFFTDYMEGNIYFKIRHPEHNLARALVQFKLTESIESQESTIRKIIREAR